MIIDDSFKNRISAARQAAELTQGELAEKVGVVRRQIAAYEAGNSKPRKNILTNLAAALGTTSEWLAEGTGEAPDLSKVVKTITLPLIPVLSYSDSIFDLKNQASFSRFVPSIPDASDKAFAYEIMGDSMTSSYGVSFPSGTIVIIDPSLEPNNMDYVLHYIDGFCSFKQLMFDQGDWYLCSLNDDYPSYIIEDMRQIIGVALQAQVSLTSDRIKANKKFRSTSTTIDTDNNLQEKLSAMESKLQRIENLLNTLTEKK
ncbi:MULTISPECIES: LexA family protein [unclassified Providencia]|uniref:LexA family protein n=1 Tax=unclassified Providencia TaxID=2633465 RepID=UPI00234BD3DC|nr:MULTISPECIES: LexA family transcriptional regulator [unclassified Providencia]